jgi:hypothetical protein
MEEVLRYWEEAVVHARARGESALVAQMNVSWLRYHLAMRPPLPEREV